MSRDCCHGCGDDEAGLVKRGDRWLCDPCDDWERDLGDLDLDEYEQGRRERLAEAQEY